LLSIGIMGKSELYFTSVVEVMFISEVIRLLHFGQIAVNSLHYKYREWVKVKECETQKNR
jgi:hypothetical protein